MNILGIDIGTTTVTALVLDTENKAVAKSCTLKNDSFIEGKPFERLQDPEKIIKIVKEAVASVTENVTPDAVGVTGQMHGILYLDEDFSPCSPLMIWQDERGNEAYNEKESYAEFLTRKTGIKAASGFGLTTHFYNVCNNLVPENAVMLSTIHDYLVGVLTKKKPLTHSSDGASLGFFDIESLCFDEDALFLAGINPDFLPEVLNNTEKAGATNCDFLPDGIPVSVAIGDNQASFLGSVADSECSVLVNVGTGSQVSFATESTTLSSAGEIRPLTDDKYLYVGSSLCGGRAYAILKNFFSLCADMLGGSKDNLYEKMDALSEGVFNIEDALAVNCEFCGTRDDPSKRGFIENIGTENLTPQHLICGVLKGVSKELFDMYNGARNLQKTEPQYLVCSGNGLRKSEVWRAIFNRDFSLPTHLPLYSEEAAIGACVFASVASGIFPDIATAQNNLLR